MFKKINGEQDWINMEYQFNGHYPVAIVINDECEVDTEFAGQKHDQYVYSGHVLFVVKNRDNWPCYGRFKKAVHGFKHRNDVVSVPCPICGNEVFNGPMCDCPNGPIFCEGCD